MTTKILAIKLRSMGDTVLLTAPLQALAAAYPQAELHVLVKSEWAPLLEGIPVIHKIWTFDPPSLFPLRAAAIAQTALQLRHENYEMVVNFHASSTSALLARATGAPIRSIHFHGHTSANRYSTVTLPGKGILKPIIERDMDAVRALGLHVPAGKTPLIPLQKHEIQQAEEWIQKMNFSGPILALNLGASRPTKCWPLDRFASLAIDWILKNKGSVFAFGGPQEEHLIHAFLKAMDDLLGSIPQSEIRAKVRTQIVTAHGLKLRFLASILSRASVLAGNDSGPKHLAVAVGTPTVTLFGPEHPFEWHPYSPDRHPYFFIEPLNCRKSADPGMPPWCGLSECIVEEHRCMNLIGVDAVLSACQKIAQNPLKLSIEL